MKFVRRWWAISAGLAISAVCPGRAGAQGTTCQRSTEFIAGRQSLGGIVPSPSLPDLPLPAPTDCTCEGVPRGLRGALHRMRCKRNLQEKVIGYPEEFNEWPLGTALYAHGRTQVANGLAGQMVFYRYDFIGQTDTLNIRGKDKLAKVAAELPTNFFPVIIERTPDIPGLDDRRRTAVINALAGGPFPVPAERVVIGPPIANGLNARESIIVNINLQAQTLSRGSAISNVGGASGLDATGLSSNAVGGGIGAGAGGIR